MALLLHRIRDAFITSPSQSLEMAPPVEPKIPIHPYYPLEAEIVGYLANEWDTLELCGMFAGGCTVIFAITYLVVKRLRPSVSVGDLATVMWFVLCMNTYPTRPTVFRLT
jgi:cholestenol Delta-isomerase